MEPHFSRKTGWTKAHFKEDWGYSSEHNTEKLPCMPHGAPFLNTMISASHDNVFPLYLFLSSGMNAAEKTPQH